MVIGSIGLAVVRVSILAEARLSGSTPTPTPGSSPTQYVPTDFWQAWLLSSGFAGSAAAVAALLTFVGVLVAAANIRTVAREDRSQRENDAREDRLQREEANAREQWWSRAQWGIERALDADDATARAGFAFLGALAESKLAGVHEGDLISAVTSPEIDQFSVELGPDGAIIVIPNPADAEPE